MVDLNVMLLEHVKTGLQTRLDKAVTDGDTEEARKVAKEMADLNGAAAPKQTGFGQAEIIAEMGKNPKYGVDPKWSARAMELGKNMDPRKFTSAGAFAEALVKAVEDDLKPAGAAAPGDEEEETEEEETGGEAEGAAPAKPAKPKRTDGPGEGDTGANRPRKAAGPWAKLSDAPSDVQKEINRTADKMAPKTKEGREKFIGLALKSHYDRAQILKGKK